jgi:hypothetical protein
MSAKITDTFHVVKKTDSVSKKFPQKKVKNEVKDKADQQQKGEDTETKLGTFAHGFVI